MTFLELLLAPAKVDGATAVPFRATGEANPYRTERPPLGFGISCHPIPITEELEDELAVPLSDAEQRRLCATLAKRYDDALALMIDNHLVGSGTVVESVKGTGLGRVLHC